MRKKVSVLIVDHSGAATRHLSISKVFFKLGVLIVFAALVAAGIGSYNYFRLKGELQTTAGKIDYTDDKLFSKNTEIKLLYEQLYTFADEVEELRAKIDELSALGTEIIKTAKVKPGTMPVLPKDGGYLTGMGGPKSLEIDFGSSLDETPKMLMVSMHQELDQLNMMADYQRQNLQTLLQVLIEEQNVVSSTPSILPIASGTHVVTSKFGYRKSPFTSARSFHSGLDVSAKIGTPIVSTGAGKVIQSGWKGDYGYMITVDHGYGVVTRYAHCSKLLKQVGDKVEKGEVIAQVGNTGRSTGPHVHYEVLLNGVFVNPEKYILK